MDPVAEPIPDSVRGLLAAPPLRPTRTGAFVLDAEGSMVFVCNAEPGLGCDLFYSEKRLDAYEAIHGPFICPRCGRITLRMEEATPALANLSTPTT